jgi:hypothetical protein
MFYGSAQKLADEEYKGRQCGEFYKGFHGRVRQVGAGAAG